MNDRKALDKLIGFIQNTKWENLNEDVQQQAKKCFLDLAGVLTAGAKNNSAKRAASYVKENYPTGDCTIISTGKRAI